MIDSYNRKINYLRVSLTQRCNYNCIYCHPNPKDIPLDATTINRFIRILSTVGIEHIRFTGGEPLVRADLLQIVKDTRAIKSIKTINITSNGSLLGTLANDLFIEGVNGVNISIDSTNPDLYSYLTGGHDLIPAMMSIQTALNAGLNVKLNSVLIRKFWMNQVDELYELAKQYKVPLRFIELMPIGAGVNNEGISSDEVIPYLITRYGPPTLSSVNGNGPAHYMNIGGVDLGFIDAISHSFCNKCNRLRMLSNGDIKLCLYQKPSINIRDISNKSDEEIANIFTTIIKEKRKHHNMNEKAMELTMASIGG